MFDVDHSRSLAARRRAWEQLVIKNACARCTAIIAIGGRILAGNGCGISGRAWRSGRSWMNANLAEICPSLIACR